MNKTIVLDTSVLLAEGKRVLYRFPDSTVVIPLIVLKELESKRNDLDLGRPARSVIREIYNLKGSKSLEGGVELSNGATLRVELNHVGDGKSNDEKIVNVARYLNQLGDVYLATRDLSLAVMANLKGVETISSEYTPEHREFIDKMEEFEVDWEDLQALYENGTHKFDLEVPINTGVVLKAGTSSALAIAKAGWNFTLVKDQSVRTRDGSVSAKSKEQNIALKLLHDDTVKFVSLGGVAGGGKTMLALAEGYNQVAVQNNYKKIVVFRSMHAVGGEELGYLPGTENEKMDPWTAAVYDALGSFLNKQDVQSMKAKQMIEVLPITHVRGRTFSNSWIIVDESQNLSKSTILTLLSRVGHSSKIILTHDVSQRDNHRVGRWEGIYEVVSRFHGNKLFGHVSMTKSERSELAQTASALLDDF